MLSLLLLIWALQLAKVGSTNSTILHDIGISGVANAEHVELPIGLIPPAGVEVMRQGAPTTSERAGGCASHGMTVGG